MKLRSLLGSLQLPIAGAGVVLLAVSVSSLLTLSPPPDGSEGSVRGLAVMFLYVLAWGGVVVLSLGLAIPPRGGYGITFNRHQRGLFVTAAVTGIGSAVVPFFAFGLVYSNPELLVYSLFTLVGVSILTLSGGLLWRAGEVVLTRMFGGRTA